MILQALTRYYEDLRAQGKIDAPYSKSLNLNDPAVQEILNDKSNAALRNWNRVKMFFTTK